MKYFLPILLTVYALLGLITIQSCNGTGDAGDSIMHFLFARDAPKHPELYFDHWAKPVYVLLASPFAQFGFDGIKVFNLINTLIGLYLIAKIAQELKLDNPNVASLLAAASPLYFAYTFSGLTEPLFALFTGLGIYLCLRKQYTAAGLLISFLPYVRSEGLIVLGVFALYLFLAEGWKRLPVLICGSVIYGTVGYFVHKDVFWVLTKIPYATAHSVYGSGELFHFVDQLYYVIGLPVYILFWVGLFTWLIRFFRKQIQLKDTILFLVLFLCFFMAHSLFWYLGIFNSMGLKRVLLCMMPPISIIALVGFNSILQLFSGQRKSLRMGMLLLMIAGICIFPFTENPAALNIQRDLMQGNEQIMATKVASQMKKRGSLIFPVMYNHFFFSQVLGLDHFDTKIHLELDSVQIPKSKQGTLIVWENLYAEKKSGIRKSWLDNRNDLKLLYSCNGTVQDFNMIYAVYEKK